MEQKTARLTLLIDPNKKAAFERLCAQQDLTVSQVIRRLIREYLANHGVQFVPSGAVESEAGAAEPPAATVKAPSRRGASPSSPSAKRRDARRGA